MRVFLFLGLLAACSNPTSPADGGGPDGNVPDVNKPDVASADAAPDVAVTDAAAEAAPCQSPSTLHPPSLDGGATIYCPFSGADGGPNVFCAAQTQHCCEPTNGTSACDPIASACAANDTDWQCEDPVADCANGQSCCASAGAQVVLGDAGCANFATNFKGTTCAASCPGVVMCTSDGECPQGKTCVPFRAKGNQVGACM